MLRRSFIKIISLSLCSLLLGLLCSCGNKGSSSTVSKIKYSPFRAEQRSFKTPEGDIKYIDKGSKDGEVIVLLHGVPTSGWLYRHMIDDLTSGGYRVIVPDMLGFGSSDNPDGYTIYNEKYHAVRLLRLMDSLGVKKWHHVCHDAGGLWTQALIDRSPNRFKSLTLLNSVLLREGFNPPITMKEGFIAKTAMAGYRNRATNKLMMRTLFNEALEDSKNLTSADMKGYRKPLLEGRTKSLYYFFTQTCNSLPEYHQGLKKLAQHSCPVQVVWGVKDEMLLWKPQAEKVKELLKVKSSDVHLIKANHFLQEEQPAEVAKLIKAFVSR